MEALASVPAYARHSRSIWRPALWGDGLVHRRFHHGQGPRHFEGGLSSTGDYAAIKIQKSSLSAVGPRSSIIFVPREHDHRHLEVNESWRGYGLLADLAYASLARLRPASPRCAVRHPPQRQLEAEGGLYRSRAGHPGVLTGDRPRYAARGGDLVPRWPVIDADVHVGQRTPALALRLVGVQTPKGTVSS